MRTIREKMEVFIAHVKVCMEKGFVTKVNLTSLLKNWFKLLLHRKVDQASHVKVQKKKKHASKWMCKIFYGLVNMHNLLAVFS